MSARWSAAELVFSGTFATSDDLALAIDDLRELTQAPIIIATFSGGRMIMSLTDVRDQAGAPQEHIKRRLRNEVDIGLERRHDRFDYVSGRVLQALADLGCLGPSTLAFGADVGQPGRLGVIVGGRQLHQGFARRSAQEAALCVLGSRPAAVSLESSLELTTLSELRTSALRSRDAGEHDIRVLRRQAIEDLLDYAAQKLGTAVIVTYEAPAGNPHRFERLVRGPLVNRSGRTAMPWMPQEVVLTPDLPVPDPPELGGSRFRDLGPLVDHCFLSRDRPRRLIASIADGFQAYGVAYGFDDVRRRPIGVLCLVWAPDHAALTSYDMAVSRVIAVHVARSYGMRHADDSVRLVTRQLSAISDLTREAKTADALHCDPILRNREDVQLIAPTVTAVLRGLTDLSGAMSVTCRLISGADGGFQDRYLVRLHCEGDADKDRSPNRIDLANASTSVNAWVAREGRSVHLRALFPTTYPGVFRATELQKPSAYPGLRTVRIFRKGASSELCVPIVAERRIVGTVNLEADRRNAFDASWETVGEYVQLIGIALLEARRTISVDTVTQVGGVLDHRHRLDGELRQLADDMTLNETIPVEVRDYYVNELRRINQVVFMPRVAEGATFGERTSVADVIGAAMGSVEWGTKSRDLRELVVGPWTEKIAAVCASPLSPDAARALSFAVAQALYNVRQHGGSEFRLADREYSAMFRFGQRSLGGTESVYVSVSSTCAAEDLEGLDPQLVFRQPLDHQGGRISLGAFLAGEALRRCGGSAYLRLSPCEKHDWLVDAEFSVPVAETEGWTGAEAEQDEDEIPIELL